MSHNPCHHSCDWTDGDEPEVEDAGCCAPYPIRRDCEAPVVPIPDCDEEDPVVTFDQDTEEFTVTTVLYDNDCSPLLDSTSDPLLSLIA